MCTMLIEPEIIASDTSSVVTTLLSRTPTDEKLRHTARSG